MWETAISGAGGIMGLYVSLRREVRRSYELLQEDLVNVNGRLDRLDAGQTEFRADIRRLDQKIDAVRGELIGFLGSR